MPPKPDYLRDNFLLEVSDWLKIYDFQKGLCGVCKQPLIGVTSTDHNHKSGQVLGILCFRCNSAIREYFTVELVAAILAYLQNPPATAALGHPHYGLPGRVGTATRRKLIKKMRKEAPK